MNLLHRAQVTSVGGRAGVVASSDRRLRLNLSTSEPVGCAAGLGTNPEQLFAAACAASFLSAIEAAAAQEGIALVADSNVTVTVTMRPAELNVAGQLDVRILADLPGVELATAQRLVTRALSLCPYSRALGDNIGVRVSAL